jgi:hypothetical protein
MRHQCVRCLYAARTSIGFDRHKCRYPDGAPMPDLSTLPSDILRALAMRQITEREAWALARQTVGA